ncbi:unnamed protein product [Ectocarpus fasciculatus]
MSDHALGLAAIPCMMVWEHGIPPRTRAVMVAAARSAVRRVTAGLPPRGTGEHLRLFLNVLPAIPAVAWALFAVANWRESLLLLSWLWAILLAVLEVVARPVREVFGAVGRVIDSVSPVIFAGVFVAVLAMYVAVCRAPRPS